MGHNSVVSGHPIFTSFLKVDGLSMDPRVLGCHNVSSHISYHAPDHDHHLVSLDQY